MPGSVRRTNLGVITYRFESVVRSFESLYVSCFVQLEQNGPLGHESNQARVTKRGCVSLWIWKLVCEVFVLAV